MIQWKLISKQFKNLERRKWVLRVSHEKLCLILQQCQWQGLKKSIEFMQLSSVFYEVTFLSHLQSINSFNNFNGSSVGWSQKKVPFLQNFQFLLKSTRRSSNNLPKKCWSTFKLKSSSNKQVIRVSSSLIHNIQGINQVSSFVKDKSIRSNIKHQHKSTSNFTYFLS